MIVHGKKLRMLKSVLPSKAAKPAVAARSKPARSLMAKKAKSPPRPRDAAATAERILQSAIAEFAQNGYAGARIDAIARGADANMRMLYHYFGSKDALYISVLEAVFNDIRLQEQRLKLRNMAPLEAMTKLFEFTYSHFASNPLFIRILASENLLEAKYLTRSKRVSTLSSPLLLAIKEALSRGEAEGVFRQGIDPLQLYVSMVALSYFHISNAPTLSHLFGTNLASTHWKAQRRKHATEMMIAFLSFSPRSPS
ncbi:TetR/AcrR family transcriptional regulator [Nitrobacteraceae bacterium AZCC 2161]